MNGWVDCMILHGFNVWDEGMMSVIPAPRTTSMKPKHAARTRFLDIAGWGPGKVHSYNPVSQ